MNPQSTDQLYNPHLLVDKQLLRDFKKFENNVVDDVDIRE
jgi:hypothetical protein